MPQEWWTPESPQSQAPPPHSVCEASASPPRTREVGSRGGRQGGETVMTPLEQGWESFGSDFD